MRNKKKRKVKKTRLIYRLCYVPDFRFHRIVKLSKVKIHFKETKFLFCFTDKSRCCWKSTCIYSPGKWRHVTQTSLFVLHDAIFLLCLCWYQYRVQSTSVSIRCGLMYKCLPASDSSSATGRVRAYSPPQRSNWLVMSGRHSEKLTTNRKFRPPVVIIRYCWILKMTH